MISDGDDLPDTSTVVRYVGYGKMFKDGNGEIKGPAASAFETREGESDLSVTWCEYFAGSTDEQLRCAIEAMRSSLNVKAKACFCVSDIATLGDAVNHFSGTFRAIYRPEPDNQAHASIYGVSSNEVHLLERLAAESWCQFFSKQQADELPLTQCSKGPLVE